MALVAEGIISRVLRRAVGEQKLAFEDGCENRAMRAVRSGASGLDALVVVVAVGAIHQTGGGPGRDEAGDISVLAGGFERMEGLIGGLELQPFVGLGNLARQSRRAAVEAVGVATEAQLEFARDRVGNRAGGIDSFDAGELAGGGSGGGALVPRGRDGVRIVAVGAGGVAGAVDGVLGEVVRGGGLQNRMGAGFVELGREVADHDLAVVAGETILLLLRPDEQPRL